MVNLDQNIILTLVVDNDKAIDTGLLDKIISTFKIKRNFINWLHQKSAVDLIIDDREYLNNSDNPIEEISKITNAIISIKPIDHAVQYGSNRRKQLLVADMDSTIIKEECIDEIAIYAGFENEVKEITARSMRGDILFTPALKERITLFNGLESEVLAKVLETKITIEEGAKTLIATMKANNAYCALISGGFTYFSSYISQKVGFHSHRANRLEIIDNKLTGKVLEPILGKHAKRNILIELRAQQSLTPDDTIAIGDGANDLLMLGEAALAIAYKAKPIVAKEVQLNIIHTDLTTALYYQGYKYDEFVSG